MSMDPLETFAQEVPSYNFAFLDGHTKRSIRRAILKAVAIPGYQVPFESREMPMPPGWGTGGLQVTASLLTPDDVLKVIDQGADDATNAITIRSFFSKVAGVPTTERTSRATIIQTRHRIPETPLAEDQILVLQVPEPEPFRRLLPRETETRRLHGLADYGLMSLLLYENIARIGRIALAYDYPVRVHDRYIASPSPIPTFDNPKLHRSRALAIFGAGREKRIYAIPPYTKVESLDFDDHPFAVQTWASRCSICGAAHSYLDELGRGEDGEVRYACSDTDYCASRTEADGILPPQRRAMRADQPNKRERTD
ncbi:alpha-D-ribose 1-methylphosphonate 5-phosphate C-P-lyase PhnJ [Bradyrhizobium sp. SSUT77]|uniref:alpha-D-ribose 1-methylphosphonate 5-phosphate C-P-lyase PhnJ n=1 Tax=Bradyrhizobium sp. SSUT77 TaxID=3040603 RepID=UPI00244CBCFF|nr:alpha-D-ribose 1-methylphosphonate 5-phosphate C-P-lyase PhnJ [Bradyrhizobium sp. SSUT77]MDH2347771.1 alpha-D-ribose 1-methylphosphonate 5-phosphate C-P-lyase PhnJ [Bradyrhizobium sp. SSUT77]